MAPSTLLGLPTELKACIVSLVAQQDDRYHQRVAKSPELGLLAATGSEQPRGTAGRSLPMLSLVNKELRTLAAPHLFKELKSSRMGDRIVQFSILPSYPFAFHTLHFDSGGADHLLEATLAVAHTLPNLTSIIITTSASDSLFYDEDTFDDLTLGALRNLSRQIVKLEISGDLSIDEDLAVRLVGCFPNLKHLALLNGVMMDAGPPLAAAVDSLEYLRELRLDLDTSLQHLTVGREWSQHSWKVPLGRLEIRAFELATDEWDFINAFSKSLEWLVLQTDGNDEDVTLELQAPGETPRFPRLEKLFLSEWQGEEQIDPVDLEPILRYLSQSPIATLHYSDPTLNSFDAQHSFIKLLETNLHHLRFLDIDVKALSTPDLIFIQTLADKKNIEIMGHQSTSPIIFHHSFAAAFVVDDPEFQSVALDALHLLTLPPELKAVIVSLVAQQDDRFRARVARSPELALPVKPVTPVRAGGKSLGTAGKSLLMLSLVNKELRTFAAPHLFKELKSSQMKNRIVQFSVLANYPFAFQSLHFDYVKASHAPLLESTLAVAHTLTNLTSLTIATEAADVLFYDDDCTFDDLILGALRKLSNQIVRLEISGDEPITEELLIKLLECLPNLTHLALLKGALLDAEIALAAAVDNLAHLQELRLDLDGHGRKFTVASEWSEYPWKIPLRQLEIRAERLGQHEWDFINAFSESLRGLTLHTNGMKRKVELDLQAPGEEPRFPRLEMLSLHSREREEGDVADLNGILQFFSPSPLSTLHYRDPALGSFDIDHPLIKLLKTNPHLRVLDVDIRALDDSDLLFLAPLCASKNFRILENHKWSLFRDPAAAAIVVDNPESQPLALEALERTPMASPTLLGLPLELKKDIVALAAQQDDRYRERVGYSPVVALQARAGVDPPQELSGKSLESLSLVNKELRELAAPHLFKVLRSTRSEDRIFQFSILQKYPFAFQILHLEKPLNSTGDKADHLISVTLAIAHTLPNLTSVIIEAGAARILFQVDDDDNTTFDDLPLGALRTMSDKIIKLAFSGYDKIPEDLATNIVKSFPELTHLTLLNGVMMDAGAALAAAVDSLPHLQDLHLDLKIHPNYVERLELTSDWSHHPWKLPLRRLCIEVELLGPHELNFIQVFSGSLEGLTLLTEGKEDHVELGIERSDQEPRFPRLKSLFLANQRQETEEDEETRLREILQYFSRSPIVTLSYRGVYLESMDDKHPLIKLLGTNLPHLRFLDVDLELFDNEADRLFLQRFGIKKNIEIIGILPTDLFSDSLVAGALLDDVELRPTALEALQRAIAFGRAGIERAENEKDDTTLKRLFTLLASLEDERLRWTD
ncbi:hypothetical protein RQP46_008753 [Phenoliferia psychrophenolica]